MADNGGLPGAVLEHIGNIQGNPSGNFALATGTVAGTTMLTGGTTYRLGGVTGAGRNVAIVWGNGGTLLPEAGTHSGGVNGAWGVLGGNSTAVQFVINGNAITAAARY